MSYQERYEKVLREVFELAADAPIDKDMDRENTEKWDSLLHLTLITGLEDEFDIMLESEDILNFRSYKDGLQIVEKYCAED